MEIPAAPKLLHFLTVLLLLLTGTFAALGQTFSTVEQVPDPKKGLGTGYVSDPGNILKPEETASLQALIAEMEDSTTAQVAVVVLPSIGEQSPKEFATALFNHWKIGQKEKDNGLLMLVVMDQRRTEFETGDGLESVLPDIVCYRVGMQELVPYFQQGQYGQGLIAAVSRFKTILENPEVLGEINDTEKKQGQEPLHWFWYALTFYLFSNVVFHIWTIARITYILLSKQELSDRYDALRRARSVLMLVVFPFPYVFIYWLLSQLMRRLRHQPRYSRKTGAPMRLLREEEEDAYLKKGQITEEEIGTADYDVWVAESDEDILILRYAKSSLYYSKCPKCRFVTYYLSETKTISQASYSDTGLKHEKYHCKNCHFSKTKEIIIPRDIPTSSSSSSSSFSGSSWSGSSGSSSGSSSWGGGRSSGGGSGVSW